MEKQLVKRYYVPRKMIKLEDLKVCVDIAGTKFELPLSSVVENKSIGVIFVYETLEDLKEEFPGEDYFFIEIKQK